MSPEFFYAKGNLEVTEEWRRIICANASAMRDYASGINDTLGLPPVDAAAGSAGAAAARRFGGYTRAASARVGVGVTAYSYFISIVAQTTTGQGWRPLRVQLVPKAEPSGCQN